MIKLETDLQGKRAVYGEVEPLLSENGFTLGDNWDFHNGLFDSILHRSGGETIYLRLPFDVLSGQLDHPDALIAFGQPFVIKHVVNIGLDYEESAVLTATGFEQFQEPLDKDGHIKKKSEWEERGEEKVASIFGDYLFLRP